MHLYGFSWLCFTSDWKFTMMKLNTFNLLMCVIMQSIELSNTTSKSFTTFSAHLCFTTTWPTVTFDIHQQIFEFLSDNDTCCTFIVCPFCWCLLPEWDMRDGEIINCKLIQWQTTSWLFIPKQINAFVSLFYALHVGKFCISRDELLTLICTRTHNWWLVKCTFKRAMIPRLNNLTTIYLYFYSWIRISLW